MTLFEPRRGIEAGSVWPKCVSSVRKLFN